LNLDGFRCILGSAWSLPTISSATAFREALARELARDEDEADELAARTMAEAVARRPGSGRACGLAAARALAIFRRERRNEERRDRHARTSFDVAAVGDTSAPATVDLVARIELEHTIAAAFGTRRALQEHALPSLL